MDTGDALALRSPELKSVRVYAGGGALCRDLAHTAVLGGDALRHFRKEEGGPFGVGHLALCGNHVLINGNVEFRCNVVDHFRVLGSEELRDQESDAFVGCHTKRVVELRESIEYRKGCRKRGGERRGRSPPI